MIIFPLLDVSTAVALQTWSVLRSLSLIPPLLTLAAGQSAPRLPWALPPECFFCARELAEPGLVGQYACKAMPRSDLCSEG